MKEWHFNVLFFIAIGGALLALVGPEFGLEVGQNPTALTGVGAILTYVLTQRRKPSSGDEDNSKKDQSSTSKEESDDGTK